jgi:hypothetical protein
MRIDWVNHASFILDNGHVRLISDPWISGTAFDHGWKHIVPSQFTLDDFAGITHIWFSHEHPDHFSPKNIQAIPAQVRAGITAMYHSGVDHRVGEFCRNAGFKQLLELRSGQWVRLGDDFDVLCGESGSGDTWLCSRSKDALVLNINDGVLERRWRLDQIARAIGDRRPDVLLSQFSYANWVGNPEDVETRQAEAIAHLERLELQCEVLRPRFIVPFASMVWFCHVENFYLNKDMNSIASAYRFLQQRVDAVPVALFPAESWKIGDDHDSEESLRRYAPYYKDVARQPELLDSPPVDSTELKRLAVRFFRLLEKRNPRWAIVAAEKAGLLKSARVYLWDQQRTYEMARGFGLREMSIDPDDCDVAMGSESLAYALRFLWGGATVHVNGRFRTPKGGDFKRFYRYMLIANYNNRGWSILDYVPVAITRIRDRLEGRSGRLFEQRQ